jgi:hypothetical protein
MDEEARIQTLRKYQTFVLREDLLDMEYYPGPEKVGLEELALALGQTVKELGKSIQVLFEVFRPLITTYDEMDPYSRATELKKNRSVGPRPNNTFDSRGRRTY